MVYITKKELNSILKDYRDIKKFLIKNRLLERYIKTNKKSRSFFNRRIDNMVKIIKSKVR